MCLAVYIASSEPLPLVEWHEESPAFYVSALSPDEERVRSQFKQKGQVVYAGSHEGCGCGFPRAPYWPGDYEPEERAAKRASREALLRYLESALVQCEEVQMFSCWEGDQERPPSEIRTISIEQLKGDDFQFRELELLTVTKRDA